VVQLLTAHCFSSPLTTDRRVLITKLPDFPIKANIQNNKSKHSEKGQLDCCHYYHYYLKYNIHTMFVIGTIADTIRIPPTMFYQSTRTSAHQEIDKKYPNRVIMDVAQQHFEWGHSPSFSNDNCAFPQCEAATSHARLARTRLSAQAWTCGLVNFTVSSGSSDGSLRSKRTNVRAACGSSERPRIASRYADELWWSCVKPPW
jgi:hypothetical protein